MAATPSFNPNTDFLAQLGQVSNTHPAERVAAPDPLERISKYLDHDALVALADCIEESDPTYPGAFDLQFMKPLVAPGNVIAPLDERVSGLSAEESLGNYVHYGQEYADVATAALRTLFPDQYNAIDAADRGLVITTECRGSLVLGMAVEKALAFKPELQAELMKQANKIADKATYFHGPAEERPMAIEKFGRKLSALLSDVFTANQEG